MKTIAAILFVCVAWLPALGQQVILNGKLMTDANRPMPATKLSVAGGPANTTDDKGQFKLTLTGDFSEGERVIIKVIKPGWVINHPLDGEWNLPNIKLQNLQTLNVIIVPRGSKALWTHARIEKQIARLSDEIARLKKEGDTPRPIDFSLYLREWAEQYGFTPAQVKTAFDDWARAVKTAEAGKDTPEAYRKLGLEAFYRSDFAAASEYLDKAAALRSPRRKRMQEQYDKETLDEYDDRRQAGNSRMSEYKFREALASYNLAQQLLSELIAKEKHQWEQAEIEVLIGDAKQELGNRVEGKEVTLLLAEAVGSYKRALTVLSRDSFPREWAITQNNLGIALGRQAERTEGAEGARLLVEAVKVYRDALSIRTREQSPQDWAMTQSNLGGALLDQGERTEGAAGVRLLAEAVKAYRDALSVRTREQWPRDWAMTQNGLGVALLSQGERTEGAEGARLLAEAVKACHNALSVFIREQWPQDWAMTQNNLGNALRSQGERTEGAAGARLLAEAVKAYRDALSVRTREQFPQQWAMTQNNLGIALQNQGERTEGAEGAHLLAEAVKAYRDALSVYTREQLPQDWAMTQNNLGGALRSQGERSEDANRDRLLKEAVNAFQLALQVRDRRYLPRAWARTQKNLARAYIALLDLNNATEAYASVLTIFPDDEESFKLASIFYHGLSFRFDAAFELRRRWLEANPNDLSVLPDFAENHFTTGRFAECQARITALLAHPEFPAGTKTALRMIEIANLLSLGQAREVPAKLDLLSQAVAAQPADFKLTWTFNGTLHFINQAESLQSYRAWLQQLFAAAAHRDRAAILQALRAAQAEFKW
jgi:tetratricopeptide (TPR) repeat protein